MKKDEIVTALRCCASDVDCAGNCPLFGASTPDEDCSEKKDRAAADLIENQQRHIEALLQANAALRDTVLRRDAQIEKMSAELTDARNEIKIFYNGYDQLDASNSTGIKAVPCTAYQFHDDSGDYICDSCDSFVDDILRLAYVEVE